MSITLHSKGWIPGEKGQLDFTYLGPEEVLVISGRHLSKIEQCAVCLDLVQLRENQSNIFTHSTRKRYADQKTKQTIVKNHGKSY
mgnify:CR=1 FL=1